MTLARMAVRTWPQHPFATRAQVKALRTKWMVAVKQLGDKWLIAHPQRRLPPGQI